MVDDDRGRIASVLLVFRDWVNLQTGIKKLIQDYKFNVSVHKSGSVKSHVVTRVFSLLP